MVDHSGTPMKLTAVFLAITALLAWGRSTQPTAPAQDSFAAMLDGYGDGRVPGLEIRSFQAFRTSLEQSGWSWIHAGPREDRQRRRQVVSLAVLDGLVATSNDATLTVDDLEELLEWACALLRNDSPSEFERTWMLATVAFMESVGQETMLVQTHIPHAATRFPDDARFKAAPIFARIEVNVLTRRPTYGGDGLVRTAVRGIRRAGIGLSRRIPDTMKQLDQLQQDVVAGPIARVRLGILQYELGSLANSRRTLTAALTRTKNAHLLYLSHLVLGLGYATEARNDDARRSFEAAVAVDPLVISGALELAQQYFASGQRDRGADVLDRAIRANPARDDPWHRSCADCDAWSDRLSALHTAVRK